MRRTLFILLLSVSGLPGMAQGIFKTMLPGTAVPAGTAFRVEYYIEQGSAVSSFTAPDFTPFRLVEGPDIHKGEGNARNYVFTLEAPAPGNYLVRGAFITINGKMQQSDDVPLLVLPAGKTLQAPLAAAPVSEYFLKPGENVQEKIRQNLFLKLETDKRSCYVGEPVLATFKLYSRLESRSDIIKNPGFYGFTVYDMIGVDDHQQQTGMFNGKEFDVHIIRKVQLYPLQAGRFTIDPMELRNQVEFSTSVNRKTQQTIAEGMMSREQSGNAAAGTETVESLIHTDPLTIEVKPLPEKNKPADFNGAVGRFRLEATLEKNQLASNEEGFLLIALEGKGNFTQLSPPAIQWPAGMEGFAATVTDSLDKDSRPLGGKRIFRYGFTAAPGLYRLPDIRFSYFNTDSNRYVTLTGHLPEIKVSTSLNKTSIQEEHQESVSAKSERKSRMALLIVISLVLAVLAFWSFKKKPDVQAAPEKAPERISVEKRLAAAAAQVNGDEAVFYSELQQAIWSFFDQVFELHGTARNRESLLSALQKKPVEQELLSRTGGLFSACETGMYTQAQALHDRDWLLAEAKDVLEQLEKKLF